MEVPSFTLFLLFSDAGVVGEVFRDVEGVTGTVPAWVTAGVTGVAVSCGTTGVPGLSGSADCVHPEEKTRAAMRIRMRILSF
jgi:hypothetical protein